jgi:hypothetical protein
MFLKTNQSKNFKPILDVSTSYYKIVLVIAIITLLLNIFIEIKKQYPHLIFSTLGLIGLLVLLIVV